MKILFLGLFIFGSLSWEGKASSASERVESFYEKQAKKCTDLQCVRLEIDRVNDELIELLVKRTAFVRRAGDMKLHTKIANDAKRVNDQLEAIAKKSEKLGLPRELSVDIFRAIIKNSIEYEQRYLDNGAKN